jgi:uncharacterized OB-fold protein
MSEKRPLPVSNADGEPYWTAADDGRLAIQRCRSCGHTYFLPRCLCPSCWSSDKEWVTAAGRGRIYSFSIIHRAPLPSFKHDVPYVVALIELEEGPRMMSNIVGEGALEAKIGDPVTVCFEDRGGRKLPQFQLAR